MTEDEVRNLIRKKAARYAKNKGTSGVTTWGKAHGISTGHLSMFMNGTRGAETKILDALGLEWRICRKTRRLTERNNNHG